MAYTSDGLVEYVKNVLHTPPTRYAWGGLMRVCTSNYLNQLAKMYPYKYTAQRKAYLANYYHSLYLCDCVGLIKSYYFGGVGSPKYNAQYDFNTLGMYHVAEVKGPICTLPEEPGVILYMKGHVGVYIGSGKCIECTLGDYGDGVVQTRVYGRGWTHWLKLPMIDYPDKPHTIDVTIKMNGGKSEWQGTLTLKD